MTFFDATHTSESEDDRYFVRTVLHAGGAPESSPPVGLKTEANPGLRHG